MWQDMCLHQGYYGNTATWDVKPNNILGQTFALATYRGLPAREIIRIIYFHLPAD
jgi:hypothetical protein